MVASNVLKTGHRRMCASELEAAKRRLDAGKDVELGPVSSFDSTSSSFLERAILDEVRDT